MKKIQIQIIFFFILGFAFIGNVSASSEKSQGGGEVMPLHTQHPPHDHHHTDHIKKLDEAMRRKRTDEKEPD